eukprot:scaffold681264_cov109-Prasinocladus_malaysianus.AAC.1
MDYTKIRKKLKEGEYATPDDFEEDFFQACTLRGSLLENLVGHLPDVNLGFLCKLLLTSYVCV